MCAEVRTLKRHLGSKIVNTLLGRMNLRKNCKILKKKKNSGKNIYETDASFRKQLSIFGRIYACVAAANTEDRLRKARLWFLRYCSRFSYIL